MIELVLVYCLTATPKRCQERREFTEQPMTAMSCLVDAQRIGLAYAKAHPQWHLAGWRCEVDKPRQRPA